MDQSFKEEELFAAASALAAPERLRYLQRACAEDIDLFHRLRSLLEMFDDAGRFIDEQSHVSHDGIQHIGPYDVTQELGEGGCAIAYLAQQSAPIRRQVALKVIKPGMDTKAVIARFEVERQALAMMDHPNVAKVFDAGATSTGRPYFVMELVRGIKITDYCNQSRLSVPERLSVFIQVCHAIQHAHLKGIIHRDIKPSNVLVTMHDGASIAKVIDFGIAKAMGGRLTDETLHTVFEQFIGTPAYVSPEQTNPGSTDIDTRSDLYSLGVLLYELLTGHTPLESPEVSQAGLDGLRQRIREHEPLTPSKRLGALTAGQLARNAARYRSSASRLIKEIRADLDWIVMRCLEKERARRYQTANDLILDLQRYLKHEPVLARPPTLAYVVRKFARRRRVLFAASLAGAVFVLCIAAFAVITSVQAQRIAAERERAEQQRARAEKVSKFMVQIFDAAQPFTSLGRDISARDVLDEASRRIRSDLSEHPEVRARLLEAIGRSYSRMWQSDRAVTFLEESLRIQEQLESGNDVGAGSIVTELAVALRDVGSFEESDRYFRRALEISRRTTNEQTEAHAQLLAELGRFERMRSNVTQGLAYFNRALEITRAVKGAKDPEVGGLLSEISNILIWSDDFEHAEVAAREAVEIYSAVPPLHPDRVMAEYSLGEVLFCRGRIDDAALLFDRALSAQRQIFGRAHIIVADTVASLADVRIAQKDFDGAERLVREELSAHRGISGTHPEIGYLQTLLATIVMRQSKFADAEQLLRDTLEFFALNLPPDHQYIASAEHYLGEALLGQRKYKDAELILIAAMERWRRSGAPAWRSARSASALGEVLHRQGRTQEAEAHLVGSFRQLSADAGVDEDSKRASRERLTRLYKDLGQPQKLAALLEKGSQSRTPVPKAPGKQPTTVAKVESTGSQTPLTISEQ